MIEAGRKLGRPVFFFGERFLEVKEEGVAWVGGDEMMKGAHLVS
jgi:hypothetical protein